MMDELHHQIKHAAQQQQGDYRPFVFGHIATYSATQGVRLIIPSLRDEANNPVLTGWMPLGNTFSGKAWGFQAAPLGGATYENPTAGELCIVAIMDRTQGLMACLCGVYNTVNTPPFPAMQPGELGAMANSGSFVYLKADNSIQIDTSKNNGVVNINCGSGQINATTTGKIVATASEIDLDAALVKASGNLQVAGTLTWINGQLGGEGSNVTGDFTATGTVTGQTDVAAGDVTSVKNLTVSGVEPGSGNSGPPNTGT